MMEFQSAMAEQPMSRTHQYRKVMKPLLERKRRARINKCLDELKDLMVYALQSEGESITKLEKADVLELTVRHLRKLKRQNALGLTPQATYAGRFRSGYTQCAQEVSRFITQIPGVDVQVSTRLLTHLGGCIQALEAMPPSVLTSTAATPAAPPSPQQAQPPLASPDICVEDEDVALDLSSGTKTKYTSDSDHEDCNSRKRQLSNDSDSGHSSMAEVEASKKQIISADLESSWRPW